MKRTAIPQVLLALVCAWSGQAESSDFFRGKIHMQERNEGYSLLYDLATSEKDVDKLFILKGANTNVTSLIKEIAENAGKMREQLNVFAEKDRRLRFDEMHIPLLEQRTRADVEAVTRNDLLFSSGTTFEVRLLYTQAQATEYGAALARQLRDTEDNQERKTYLDGVAKKWDELFRRVMKLLLPKEKE